MQQDVAQHSSFGAGHSRSQLDLSPTWHDGFHTIANEQRGDSHWADCQLTGGAKHRVPVQSENRSRAPDMMEGGGAKQGSCACGVQ